MVSLAALGARKRNTQTAKQRANLHARQRHARTLQHLVTVGGEPNPANRQVLPTMRVGRFTRLSGQEQCDWVTATV